MALIESEFGKSYVNSGPTARSLELNTEITMARPSIPRRAPNEREIKELPEIMPERISQPTRPQPVPERPLVTPQVPAYPIR